jgi:hypothetical protein
LQKPENHTIDDEDEESEGDEDEGESDELQYRTNDEIQYSEDDTSDKIELDPTFGSYVRKEILHSPENKAIEEDGEEDVHREI